MGTEIKSFVDEPPNLLRQAHRTERFFALNITPITRRRIDNFKRNKRGYWSFWIFLVLFLASMFAEFVANDKPLLVVFDGELYLPTVAVYPETDFGGEFQTEADYRDEFVKELITAKGWMIWPPVRFSYDTVNYNLSVPAPAPPSSENLLGTDDQGRDVVARLLYGFRISILFGLGLTLVTSVIGVLIGALQGYYGGWVDLFGQRLIEVWRGLPDLFMIIILVSLFSPSIWVTPPRPPAASKRVCAPPKLPGKISSSSSENDCRPRLPPKR